MGLAYFNDRVISGDVLLLQLENAGNGFEISTQVDEQELTDVWLNGTRLVQGSAMEFAPRVNAVGNYAWAATFLETPVDSLSANGVYLDGVLIAEGMQVQDLALSESHLAWISPQDDGTLIYLYDLLTQETQVVAVDVLADRIRVSGEDFVVVGLESESGESVSVVVSADGTHSVTNRGDANIQLS